MKPRWNRNQTAALTLMEVLVVIAVLAVVATIFLPMLTKPRRACKIGCVNLLKQIGLAYRLWAEDHGDKYPFELSVADGGTKELSFGRNAWRNYLVMSNQLSTPKLLVCPEDQEHQPPPTNFSAQLIGHISYFVGLDASQSNPQSFISGDDNFEIKGVPVPSGLLEVYSNTPIAWTATRHQFSGNIGLADGSVQSVTISGLTNLVQQTGLGTNRLAIP